MGRNAYRTLATLLLAVVCAGQSLAQALGSEVFATVDDTVISAQEFATAVRAGARRKFFHGSIPTAELAKFQREIGERLIEQVLLLREAERRGIAHDPDWVKPRLDAFERRASADTAWEAQREELMRAAAAQLRVDSRIRNLRAAVLEQAGTPSEDTLRAFYQANQDKFTEPERFRVSAILLKVDPSAATSVWDAAMAEAQGMVARLRGGADFAELARLHSGDASAEQGGDMGYLHRGMLGAPAQAAVDAAEISKVTDPVRVLEGVAIFRVDDRPVPQLRPFDEVTERARDLWLRERRASLWAELLDRLKAQATIQVNAQHYLPLPG